MEAELTEKETQNSHITQLLKFSLQSKFRKMHVIGNLYKWWSDIRRTLVYDDLKTNKWKTGSLHIDRYS